MFPLPFSVRASRKGRLTSTDIGVFALRLPGVVPITRWPDWTSVVTRPSRLLSAWTMTDRLAPTCTMTLFSPARSTPVKDGTERACVAATPEPVPAGLLEPKKIRSSSNATRIAAEQEGCECG